MESLAQRFRGVKPPRFPTVFEALVNYEGVHRVLAKWKPFKGLIYFHLLLDRLAEAGYLG